MSLSLGNIWTQKRVKTASSISHIGLNNIMTVRQAEKSNPELGTKRYWGNATWFLFHTIAARIEPEYYKNNINMIWKFISECCGNLPCPFCRSHATAHLKTISIHQINTKAKLELEPSDLIGSSPAERVADALNELGFDLVTKLTEPPIASPSISGVMDLLTSIV